MLLSILLSIRQQNNQCLFIVGTVNVLDHDATPALIANHLNGCCVRGRSDFSDGQITAHASKIALVCICAH